MVNITQLQSEKTSNMRLSSRIQPLTESLAALATTNHTSDRETVVGHPNYGLERLGLKNLGRIYHNLSVPQLVEHALVRNEGIQIGRAHV